ncbi:MAG: hypothetical protein LBV54_03665 [Puniceicoccales bacterium]|nr:hypothetical protein [Puniceicoccales bacterium]
MPDKAEEYFKALEDNPWIDEFAGRWILDKDGLKDDSVVDMEINLIICDAETKLNVIMGILLKMTDGRHDNILAAGMLENFLCDHGEEYLDVILEIAGKWPRFRSCLGMVWQNSMKDSVWDKISDFLGTGKSPVA